MDILLIFQHKENIVRAMNCLFDYVKFSLKGLLLTFVQYHNGQVCVSFLQYGRIEQGLSIEKSGIKEICKMRIVLPEIFEHNIRF